jgi:hypothetical protein
LELHPDFQKLVQRGFTHSLVLINYIKLKKLKIKNRSPTHSENARYSFIG